MIINKWLQSFLFALVILGGVVFLTSSNFISAEEVEVQVELQQVQEVTVEPVLETLEVTQPVVETVTAPELSTEKEDYHPGEVATIIGRYFAPLQNFVLKIFGSDEADGNYTETVEEVTADNAGGFTFNYTLDDLYRPFYEVFALDLAGNTLASTWFRDAAVGTYDQCSNDDGDGYATGDTGCRWINGNLNANNSTYQEGDSTVQRVWIEGFAPGPHSITLTYGTTKAGKHAYDFLTSWNHSENWLTEADLCQGITNCVGTASSTIAIPVDINAQGFDIGVRQIEIRGAAPGSISGPTKVSGSYSGDSETSITINFTIPSEGNMCSIKKVQGQDVTSCAVAIFFGAHIAKTDDWQALGGTGATTIPGSPYHVALSALDGGSIGSRDNQMQADAVVAALEVGHIVVIKDVIGNPDPTDFTFQNNFGNGNPASFMLDEDNNSTLPNTRTFEVLPGKYFVSEDPLAGWQMESATCDSGETVEDIDVAANETVTCTFVNEELVSITLIKNTIGGNGTFEFNLTGVDLPSSTQLTTSGNTASQTFTGLDQDNEFSITEVVPAGWSLVSATCTGGEIPSSITPEIGEDVTCTFTNEKVLGLTVTKTVNTTFTRTYGWTIEKSVDIDSHDLFVGDSATTTYTIEVTKDDGTNSNWAVSGVITITNPNTNPSFVANIQAVTDDMDGTPAPVECPSTTLSAGASMECTYSVNLPGGSNRTNIATVTTTGLVPGGQGSAEVTFGVPTTIVNDSINVDDTNGSSWQFSDSGSETYTREFACGRDEGTHENTATIVETGDSDSASVTVNCYELTVTKDALTSLDRTYTWNVEKTGDQTQLNLSPGQTLPVNYDVVVSQTGSTDSNWKVVGNIIISNPAPMNASLSDVTDSIVGADVDCPSTIVPAEDSITCTYTADLESAAGLTNTATAILDNGEEFSSSTPVTFTNATVNEIDECITLTDTNSAGPQGQVVCKDDAPKTFEYAVQVGGYESTLCGTTQIVENTATITTNDTETTDSDSHNVSVNVTCVCSLTQGYWKTHNNLFKGGAPADDTWKLIPDGLAENTPFYLSGQTWFQVFWNAPKGNAYYNLAHQYMAAKLNVLNGASNPTIGASIGQAETWFATYTPAQIANMKGKNGDTLRKDFIALAGILGAFNEGLTNLAGHCSEVPVTN